MTTIDEQIAQAKAAAAAHTAAQGGAVATVAQPGNAGLPSTYMAQPTAGRRLADEDMMVGGISVDVWFQPKEFGIKFGDASALVPSFIGYLDLREKVNAFAVKFGNPATYLKTYDNQTCAQGGSWEAALARAKAVDSNARPYNTVDLPITLAEDVKGPDGKELAKAGQRAGYGTSTTNWSNWETFYNQCKALGFNVGMPDPQKSIVRVKVGYQPRKNKNGNTWGVCTFEFVEFVNPDDLSNDAE